ncbi:MAG TPA: TonB-dependent receptor [Hyphomonadaceae bacterium]
MDMGFRTPARPRVQLCAGVCAAALAVASPAFGQETQPGQVAQFAEDAASNVTSYKPDFFTQFRPNTSFDMVTRIPGFQFDGGSNARGFAGTAGNVLIDGERPPSRSDSLSSVLSRIPSGAVERIDIIRGGAEGIDMQGKSIVANVIRKPDAGLTGAITAGANINTRGNGGLNAGIQVQDQRDGRLLEGALNAGKSNGSGENYRQRISPSGDVILDAVSHNESEFQNISATGAYESALFGGKVRVNGQARMQQNSYDNEEIQTIPAGIQVDQGDNEYANGEVGLRYTRDIGGYGVELVAFQSLEEGEFEGVLNTPVFTSASRFSEKGGESIAGATLRLPAFGKIEVETGAEGVYNWTESETANIFNGQIFSLQGDAFQADETRAEAFATLTWKPAESFNAEIGARYEWSRITAESGTLSSEKTLGYFKPRLNTSWSPIKDHQINLRAERIVDQLDFDGFASAAAFETGAHSIGSIDIEPEKSWLYEARYERQFGGQNSFVAELSHRETENALGGVAILLPGETVPLSITRNYGPATESRLELSGNMELDRFGIPGGILTLGGNLQDTETVDPVTGETRRVSYEETYGWNLSFQQTLDGGNFRWAVFVEDDDDHYNWSVRSFGKQSNLMFIGANITWKPVPGWTLGAGANNLLASGGRGWSVFYNSSRDVGVPLYLSRGHGDGATNFFVNLRRNF